MVEVCPGFARQDTRALGPDREQQIPRRAEALLVMTTIAGKQKRRNRSRAAQLTTGHWQLLQNVSAVPGSRHVYDPRVFR
jgi:hypothetical protein